MTTPANLRFIIAAMREHPTAYAMTNDALAAFAYGVLVGATDASVSTAWNAAVRAVLYPDDRGALTPDWNALPHSRVVDVFDHAANALGLTTDEALTASNAGHAITLVIQAQMTDDDAEPLFARIDAMGYPTLAEIGRRAKAAP